MRWKSTLLLLALTGALHAAAPGQPAATRQGDDARNVAAKIDEYIFAALERARVKPAAPADDATFLRRASLDVAGKPPVVSDVRKFLRETSPEKRVEAIERLLDSPGYVNNFATIWLDLLIPEARQDFNARYFTMGMQRWLRKNFAANTPYNKMAHELLSQAFANDPNGGQFDFSAAYEGSGPITPKDFYFAKKAKPEDLAASVGRVFLGVRLECAQCHDHPFGKWKREEFWSQAAFFAGMKSPNSNADFFFGPINEASDRRELTIPNTDRVAQARFLDGTNPKWKFKVGARTTLADWMTAKDNPFFARAIVNRMWAHFFGIGLVEPIDDLVDDNVPSHPEILNLLAKEFAERDFDLKFLIRAITLTRAYQLSSVGDGEPTEPRLFGRMAVKGLSSEQLFESLCAVTGFRDPIPFQQRIFNFGTQRSQFTERFTDQEKRTEYHTSIPQALTMMNNQLITDATHPDNSFTLAAIVSSPFLKNDGKIEAMFLAVLSRKPKPAEAEKFLKYVEKGGAVGNQKKALADVFWALLNSTEFKFNH